MSIDFLKASFGFYGINEISSEKTVSGDIEYNTLQALEESVVSFTSNGASDNNQSSFSDIVFPQGTSIFGKLSNVSVFSGKVIGVISRHVEPIEQLFPSLIALYLNSTSTYLNSTTKYFNAQKT